MQGTAVAERPEAHPEPGARLLEPPDAFRARLPAPPALRARIDAARVAIADLLHGRDRSRLLMVVGPCSIHDVDAAIDYGRRLARAAREHEDALLVVMRSYFEKPRTRHGWKGLLSDPHRDGSGDVETGLSLARETLLTLGALGLPCGSELLDPLAPAYLADLLSWAAIGARTCASQTHRELASGLPLPVGFKNPPDGSVAVAVDAVCAARRPHTVLGVDGDGRLATRATPGNADGHVVLRGGARPNFEADAVRHAKALAAREGLSRPLLIDCSHANSGKDHRRQAQVCRTALAQVREGEDAILGVMLESQLQPGRQEAEAALAYGVSITDACIGWEETEALLGEAAEAVRGRG